MIDPIQIFFIVIVSSLTILLTVIGIEVYKAARDIRNILEKAGKILDDVSFISNSVATPARKMPGLLQGLQQGLTLVGYLQKFLNSKKER